MKHAIKVRMKDQHHFKRYVVQQTSSFEAIRDVFKETGAVEAYYLGLAGDDEPVGYENSPEPGQPGDLEGE